jgi:AGCS family alanine or glycine:cation symporter
MNPTPFENNGPLESLLSLISQALATVVDLVWGLPLIFLLIGGGIYLIFKVKFLPLRGFFHAIKLVAGKIHHHHPHDASSSASLRGQISHFQTLSNALAATIGMGNIAGVAIAIAQGGAGAVFWMWVAAIIGMNTKFFECTLVLMFRSKDQFGEVQGGPMYTMANALPKRFQFLATFFAMAGLIGTLAVFNINQLASFGEAQYHLPRFQTGAVLAVLVCYIILGGVKRLANFTSALVPSMCILYVVGCLGILWTHSHQLIDVLVMIVKEAWSGRAAMGGVTGLSVIAVLKTGVKRASFSNEAGMGTAPMAHGNSNTSEPVAEGLVAMLGPFLDTIVVCTMTALVILVSLSPEELGQHDGVLMTQLAFTKTYGAMGTHVLGLAIFLFSFTTLIGTAYYNEKCWNFLFGKVPILKNRISFNAFYGSTLFIGAMSAPKDMVNLVDIGFALMAYPNMAVTLFCAPLVVDATKTYMKKYL